MNDYYKYFGTTPINSQKPKNNEKYQFKTPKQQIYLYN